MTELSEKDFFDLPKGTVVVTPEGYKYLVGDEMFYPENPNEPFSSIRWHKFEFKGCRLATSEEAVKYFQELESNGYKWCSETNRMKPTHPITDFEKEVGNLIGIPLLVNPEVISVVREKSDMLLAIARKQIASEIDVDAMVSDTIICENLAYYRQGIEDTLKTIKGE